MPVTKTAKRALRGSKKKEEVNRLIISGLEIAIRVAKKNTSADKIQKATSLADRAVKKNVIHKNKASRIKSQLAKLSAGEKKAPSKAPKKSSKKKAKK